MILLTIAGIFIFIGILRLAVAFTWGLFKVLFGVGLFLFCPALFVILLITGLLSGGWLLLLILIGIFGFAFHHN